MIFQPSTRLEGTGEYYFSQKMAEISRMRATGADIINLGIGNPDLPPPHEVINTLNRESSIPGNHSYQPYNGIPELRAAFSEWYQRYFGVTLNPDTEILPLIGSKEGITHISLAFLNAGDRVLIPDPGYPAYSAAARIAGATPVKYILSKENAWLPDLDQLEKSGMDGVKMIWINYPHMPSGATANLEFFKKLVDFGRKHHLLICHDNPYSFILNDHPLSILSVDDSPGVALELNSLSKSHNMAGWRIGMAGGEASLIREVLKVKSNMDSGMFRPLQCAAVQALQVPDDWYRNLNQVYHQRKQIAQQMADILNAPCDPGQSGLFVWAQIPETFRNSSEFSDFFLYRANVFITPGFIFGEQGAGYFRISLCSSENQLLKAMERIKNVLNH